MLLFSTANSKVSMPARLVGSLAEKLWQRNSAETRNNSIIVGNGSVDLEAPVTVKKSRNSCLHLSKQTRYVSHSQTMFKWLSTLMALDLAAHFSVEDSFSHSQF